MEMITMSVVTLSVKLNCAFHTAWSYLEDPINQKDWAIHFFEDISKEGDHYMATVSFGRVPLRFETDQSNGTIDIFLGEGGQPTKTRLVNDTENICTYFFTIHQPAGMPNDIWENKALPDMKKELVILKTILDKK